MSSLSRQKLEKWLKDIDVKGTILDIGGGQKALKGRTKSYNPDAYVVMDIENGDIEHDVCVPKKFEELFAQEKKFDQIFCLEVSEYFVNPCTAIMNISDWISDFGTVYMSFHFVYPLHKPDGCDMLRYTDNWIRTVFNHYGFKHIDITSRVATKGAELLRAFNKTEQMKAYKDEEIIGSLVMARKK